LKKISKKIKPKDHAEFVLESQISTYFFGVGNFYAVKNLRLLTSSMFSSSTFI